MSVTVYNWIRARFADGPNFVTDAPSELADELGLALADESAAAGCEVASRTLEAAGERWRVATLRYVPSTGAAYVHAVVLRASEDAGVGDAPAAGVDALFEGVYGAPPEERVAALVGRLELLPIGRATLSLTDLFVEADAVERLRRRGRARRRVRSRVPGSSGPVLPWLLVAASAALAGFYAGRAPVGALAPLSAPSGVAPVGAAPPDVDLARRVARLEEDRGAAGISLRSQLAHQRRLHEEALAERDARIRELERRLEAPRSEPAEPRAAAAAPPARASAAPQRARVVASHLAVRKSPDVDSVRLSYLAYGTTVELAGAPSDGWVAISAPAQGWVASEFLEPDPPAGVDERSPVERSPVELSSSDPSWDPLEESP